MLVCVIDDPDSRPDFSTQMDGALYGTPPAGLSNDALEKRIVHKVQDEAVIDLDVVIPLLSEYRWNHIFHAVDPWPRAKKIVLHRQRYNYTLFSTTG